MHTKRWDSLLGVRAGGPEIPPKVGILPSETWLASVDEGARADEWGVR
jgi:hypothetical protein